MLKDLEQFRGAVNGVANRAADIMASEASLSRRNAHDTQNRLLRQTLLIASAEYKMFKGILETAAQVTGGRTKSKHPREDGSK